MSGEPGDTSPSAPTANGEPLRAAGIMLVDKEGRVLLMRRTDGMGWAFPGGRIEEGESTEDCARREFVEETAGAFEGELKPWIRRIKDGVDFTTYLGAAEAFVPTLNSEHDLFTWASHEAAFSLPLHPGARVALERFGMDELGIAKAMAAGDLVSPQRYGNILLVAIRITGTGIAYRPSLEEFVWRDKAIYLTEEFLQRCNGLPFILQHPKKGMLNTKEFRSRIIGTTFLPFIKDEEVWGIEKVWDMRVAELIEAEKMSTSPGLVIRDIDSPEITLSSGRVLLIEGKPKILDHIALLHAGADGDERMGQGVWDVGGPMAGVSSVDAESVAGMSNLDLIVRQTKLYQLAESMNH